MLKTLPTALAATAMKVVTMTKAKKAVIIWRLPDWRCVVDGWTLGEPGTCRER
jgi:hypothetical protein